MTTANTIAIAIAIAIAVSSGALCSCSSARESRPNPTVPSSSTSTLTATSAVVATTCASQEPPTLTAAQQQTAAQLEEGIAIAESIRRTCKLPFADPDKAPHFGFDSARLAPRGAAIVDAVGSCLTAGVLAGRRVAITGHTDALGPRDYNEDLGLARAIAAKLELERVGVPTENIEVRSRGEADADGGRHSECARAADRRIAIELLP